MSSINKTLVLRKEFYRIWFEFYKISLNSTNPVILKKLNHSLTTYYYKWGDVKNTHFDDWWKTHDHLFEEESIRLINKDDSIEFDNHIILQIPVNQSVSDLMKNIRTVLTREHKLKNTRKKNKSITSHFSITEGSEPKLGVLKDVLNVYRDVYLKYPNLKGKDFRLRVEHYYQTNFKKKTSLPPTLVMGGKDPIRESQRVNRNIRRWIQWGKQIQLNVLNGQFPGDY